jgi:hypothetical protein
MYVTMPMVDYVPLGYNRKSPKSKKTVMFFITMKKVKRKTIKTCHSPDDEKNIKVAIPMLTKKISIQNNFFSRN